MGKARCALCLSPVDIENAEILTMGAYGTPKLLCDECSCQMNSATRGKEYSEIIEALDTLTAKISSANIDDRRVLETVNGLFNDAAQRANAIKEGTYDFKLDESAGEDELEDLPEELLESEEDKILDEQEAAVIKKWDKALNWVSLGVILAALGYLIYYLVS